MKKLITIIAYRKHVANVIKYNLHIIFCNRHFDFHYKTNFNL